MKPFLYTMALALAIVISTPLQTHSDYTTPAPRPLTDYSVKELVEYFSASYNQDSKMLLSVANCESQLAAAKKGDWSTRLKKYLAYGPFQTHEDTFNTWKKEMGEPDLDYHNVIDQVKVSVWAFSQGETYRDDWTTYRALIRGGVYSFHSKQLEQDFTVYCSLKDFSTT